MKARPLMILGTGSHVGKSVLTAALGRIISDDGFRVAPFKAQNMSLNSAATPDGREIGRAQALQAEACRTAPRAEMNPILIKPSTHTSSQVVVLGRVWGQVDASDYHRRRIEELFPLVVDSYRTLAAENDILVLEGAGSPAEINLKARDIANMRMASAANAVCLLVGDIDRGGIFASLLGTLELLDEGERPYIRGFIVNKFRGDESLLAPGINMIEHRMRIPCAGVVPYIDSLGLDEEDSVSMEQRPTAKCWTALTGHHGRTRPLRIAVIALPHISNFTDFDALAAEPSVSLAYANGPGELAVADMVVIPGTKQTLDDLAWLKRTGIASAIEQWHSGRAGAAILIGICGGMQMLGRTVEDADGVETGSVARAEGLGLLPVHTRLRSEKVTRCAAGSLSSALLGRVPEGTRITGYEIHLGETEYLPGARCFAEIVRAGSNELLADGALAEEGSILGTYLHGVFDEDSFRHAFIQAARLRRGLAPACKLARVHAEREQRIDRLAAEVRRALDMDLIYRLLELPRPACSEEIPAHDAV
jgi:adenosylcobyric acid synthase